MIWFFPSSELDFSILSSRFYDLRSFFWKLFSNFVHMSFEVLLLVFLNFTMLFASFGVGGSRACVRHVLPTSSDVGQCRFQSVSTLYRLEVGRWKFVFSMFGSDWFCTLLGRLVHGSIGDGLFLFPSGSMLLLRVEGRIKLWLCKQPFLRWRMLIWMWRRLFLGLRRLERPFLYGCQRLLIPWDRGWWLIPGSRICWRLHASAPCRRTDKIRAV